MESKLTPSFLASLLKDKGSTTVKEVTISEFKGDDVQLGSFVQSASVSFSDKEDLQKLFIKVCCENSNHTQMNTFLWIFDKETQMYSIVIPDLLKFIESTKSDFNLNFIPKFIHAGFCEKDQFIILEDVKELGFHSWPKKVFHERDQAELVIQDMAKFHAASYSMKKVENVDILKKYPFLSDRFCHPDCEGFMNPMITGYYANTIELLTIIHKEFIKGNELVTKNLSSTLDEDLLQRFSDSKNNLFSGIATLLQNPPEPNSLITHGDLHMYNILLKESPNSTNKFESKIFDFQMSRYGSGLLDFQHYIIQSTTPEFRKTFLDQGLNLYYETFRNNCIKLGVNSKDVCYDSKESVVAEFERTYLWGYMLVVAFLMLRYVSQTDLTTTLASHPENLEERAKEVIAMLDKSDAWNGISILFDNIKEADNYKAFEKTK